MQVGEYGRDHGLRLGAEVARQGGGSTGEDEGSEGSEDLAEGECRGVAIDYHDLWRGVRADFMEVRCEGRDKLPLGAIAVETDIEGLRKFEAPLGKGAGVKGVKIGDRRLMRVNVGTDLVVILFVGEKR